MTTRLKFLGYFVAEMLLMSSTVGCSKDRHQTRAESAADPSASVHAEHDHGNPSHLKEYVERLESPERAGWQKPDEVIAKLGLEQASVVCDVGAGPGYFSLRVGRAIGPQGTVYAVDVDPAILGILRSRIEASDVRNVIPVLGLADDPLLPNAACDRILLVNTFHHFRAPVDSLKRLVRSLKPDGRVVNIDFEKRPTPMGPPEERRIAREQFIAFAEQAGLHVVVEHDLLEHQYFLELSPR